MKKIKIGLMALSLIAGVAGAFASTHRPVAKTTDAMYHWTKYNHNGTRDAANDEDATIAGATADYSCPGNVTLCATGEKIDSGTGPLNPVLKFIN